MDEYSLVGFQKVLRRYFEFMLSKQKSIEGIHITISDSDSLVILSDNKNDDWVPSSQAMEVLVGAVKQECYVVILIFFV